MRCFEHRDKVTASVASVASSAWLPSGSAVIELVRPVPED